MKKVPFLLSLVLSLFISSYVFNPNFTYAQTVYFQRFLSGAGSVSSVSALGPVSTLVDLASGISNARISGVDTNGSGLVFYVDRAAAQILAVDSSRTIYPILLPFSGIVNPQGISLDVTGNFLYIADTGNNRIVRVNLSLALPAAKVQVVVDPSANVTYLVSDIKYNPKDGYLYWTNDGTFHRAAVSGRPMPVESGETLLTKNSIEVRYFDFDAAKSQTVYFSSGSGGFQGIFKAPVPPAGDTPNLNESRVLDLSATPDASISGIGVDKNSAVMCFTATNTPASVMRCGDRLLTPLAEFKELLSAEFTIAPNFFAIESPSSVVSPITKLPAPLLQLHLELVRPELRILLRQFDQAVLKAVGRVVSRASSGKIGFRYVVDIQKTRDASGRPVPVAKQDLRRKFSLRNLLTAKNLKVNSTYSVQYSIEITRNIKGKSVEVVKRTKLSPVSQIVVPAKG